MLGPGRLYEVAGHRGDQVVCHCQGFVNLCRSVNCEVVIPKGPF